MKSSNNNAPHAHGEIVTVLYVDPTYAKMVKTVLENEGVIHTDFRMTKSSCSSSSMSREDELKSKYKDCIAIPIHCDSERDIALLTSNGLVKGSGSQFCPYSTAFLGNNNVLRGQGRGALLLNDGNNDNDNNNQLLQSHKKLTLVQTGLLEAIYTTHITQQSTNKGETETRMGLLLQDILSLPREVCPSKLEVLGDDRTVVIPPQAFDLQNDAFAALLATHYFDGGDGDGIDYETTFLPSLWANLASLYQSHRVVRRGGVDRNSRIRHSGYSILWVSSPQAQPANDTTTTTTGPDSPGWITVTEQGIRQSFDLTRVMFSRGNISEKIRFGKIVQEGELVLDLYAGIGYFTLPALVHGGAAHVYCCEWNGDAVEALRYNLQDNGVDARATVFAGDCRKICQRESLQGKFDRVSLGLLPSSQGGWRTALKALSLTKGGWLHIHGNVPVAEMDQWALWMCQTLRGFLQEDDAANVGAKLQRDPDWIVLAAHIEKVKSFAPTINHYVADVFVGPLLHYQPNHTAAINSNLEPGLTGVLKPGGALELCCCRRVHQREEDAPVAAPSCALSDDGALHQEWMRDPQDTTFETPGNSNVEQECEGQQH